MIKNIKKIRFNIVPQSYGEMGHLEFFNKDVPLKVNMSQRTLTLQSGQVVNIISEDLRRQYEKITCDS